MGSTAGFTPLPQAAAISPTRASTAMAASLKTGPPPRRHQKRFSR